MKSGETVLQLQVPKKCRLYSLYDYKRKGYEPPWQGLAGCIHHGKYRCTI